MIGADMAVFVINGDGAEDNLYESELNPFLERQEILTDFAYMNQPLNQVLSPD